MGNKRGISNIIATLLLVLLVIVIIGIVWVIVRNIVSSANSGISLGGITLNLKITQAVKGTNNLSITIQRQQGAGNLVGVNFIVSDGSTYETIKQNATLDVYQGRTFNLIPQQIIAGSAKIVSIAPIYIGGNGLQQVGSVTDTYTFGNQIVINSCTPASDPTFAGLCGSNNCGQVNNGTCALVNCGSNNGGCPTGQICNLVTNQCISQGGGGGGGCSPAPDPTLNGLCTNNGYTCGNVNNGTCNIVSCGSCAANQYCDLSVNQCKEISNPPPCQPGTCLQFGYQCGFPPNGCGGNLTCGNQGACGGNSFCNSVWQCVSYQMVNSGAIYSAWPIGAPTFFDSSALPVDSTSLGDYNDGAHYIRFPGSNESNCIQLALIAPELSPSTMSYVRLGSLANITAGNNYQIWNSQQGCINHPGYS